MSRKLLFFCAIISLFVLSVAAQQSETTQQSQDLSQDRGLGIGLQAPCVISFRYWLSESFAVEVNAFLISGADFTSGCVAAKVLFRAADTSVFDFYALFEANLHIGDYWGERSIGDIALKGGMELSILPSLALDLEFGEAILFGPDRLSASPAVSLGVHYYFLRVPRAEPKPPEPEQP